MTPIRRSPLDAGPLELRSPFSYDTQRSPLVDVLPLLYSPFADIPLGTGEQDWGVPLWSADLLSKQYTRMNPDFTVPVDATLEVDLVPKVSPPPGQFPVEVGGSTFFVDLEFVVFT